jgi:hypothetical protein
LWAFGFATTLLLIGMWGRTVAVDTSTVEEAAQTVVDAGIATERIEAWLETGLGTALAADAPKVRAVAEQVVARPEFDAAVDAIVADFVAGVFAEPGSQPVIELDDALAPLVPVVVGEAAAQEVPVEPDSIEEVLATASTIALDTGETASAAAVVDEARTFLTWIVLLAAAALTVLGGLAIALAEHRYAMVRTLSTRVVISALTYALLFRVAAWALDPQRGRSPVLGGGSVVLGSNGHIFLIAGAIAAVVAVWGGLVAYRRRAARPTIHTPTDDDTRELVTV